MSRVGIRRAVVALLVVSAIGVSDLARADEWGVQDGDTGPPPDLGPPHNWCWGPGFDVALQDNANSSGTNALNGPTDATAVLEASCDTTGVGQTDVRWLDENLPPDWRGLVLCAAWRPEGTCDRADIKIDPAELNIGINDEEDTTKSTCHELGHSVGLTHRQDGGVAGGAADCMFSGERPNLNIQYERYSTHHVGHINAWF